MIQPLMDTITSGACIIRASGVHSPAFSPPPDDLYRNTLPSILPGCGSAGTNIHMEKSQIVPRHNRAESVHSTAALRDSEERFRLMVESVKDYAIFMLDPDGRITSWNEGAQRIKGYTAEEIIGRHFSIFYPEEKIAQAWPEHEIESALAEGRFEDEGWRLRKDGTRFWANVVITPVYDDEKRHIGFAKVTRDLSERRRKDDELRQSEERLRLMIESVKDYAIFMLDPDGRITSWNEGAQRIKGYSTDEIVGKHFSIFYPPEALAKAWPEYELKVARAEGRFEDEGWRLRKDGSRFWANVVITALWTEEKELVGFTKVTRDLSERKRHEEALKHSEQRLEQAYLEVSRRNSELQDFTHAASHDLQEPLRKMCTFAELLEMECNEALGEAGRIYVDRIRDSALRMSALVSNLLSYSRLTTRTQPIEQVDLSHVVKDVVADLDVLLEETGGRVDETLLPTIEADESQMRQLFMNLIGNGLKFHRPGVPPVVWVGTEPSVNGHSRSAVKIIVEDNGIGFEEKYADEIFSPFHRLHTRQEFDGTGLGLAICRRIVERHQGTIAAQSVPGKGARFTITLPLRQHAA